MFSHFLLSKYLYKKTYKNAIFPSILANVTGEAIHSPSALFALEEKASEFEFQFNDDSSILPDST